MLPIAIPVEWILFGARAALLAAGLLMLAVALGRWRRATVAQAERLAQALDETRSELRLLTELSTRLADRVGALQDQITARAELSAAQVPAAAGYDVGLRLARNGATPEEIAATSGVTRQEAQLLARLHGPDHRLPRTGT
jgi:hypothetical protein